MASRISWRSIRRLSLCCRSGAVGCWFDLQTQRIGRGDARWRGRLPLARQYGYDHVTAGDARLQGFGTGRLDRSQSVIEHRTEDFDELTVGIGMRLQLRADLGQAGRQIPVLEWCTIA